MEQLLSTEFWGKDERKKGFNAWFNTWFNTWFKYKLRILFIFIVKEVLGESVVFFLRRFIS